MDNDSKQLSPADQIMIAVAHVYQAHGDDPPIEAVAAAVLAAAADQVDAMNVPNHIRDDAYWPYRDGRNAAKEHFLAIAAELGDGAPDDAPDDALAQPEPLPYRWRSAYVLGFLK